MDFIVFIFGAAIGSFLNVCIFRFQEELSIVKPRSFCPSCKKQIKWYDNIPVLSYIILRGKCRNCGSIISLQYPLIELLAGILTVLMFKRFSNNLLWLVPGTLVCYLLIVVSVIDFKTMMISDFFPYSIAFLGLLSSFVNPSFDGAWHQRFFSSIYGIICGAGFVFALSYIGKLIYKKEAVGDGDIFLLGAIGSITGAYGIISVVTVASFLGTIYGVSLILMKRAERLSYMPFGPFLSIACIINIYYRLDIFSFLFS